MTPDLIQARNSALEIFEHLTIAQSSSIRFNDRLRDNKVEDAKFALMQLAAYLGFNVEPVQPCSDALVAEIQKLAGSVGMRFTPFATAIDQRDDEDGNDPVERSYARGDAQYSTIRDGRA